jgi:hypothetical protein
MLDGRPREEVIRDMAIPLNRSCNHNEVIARASTQIEMERCDYFLGKELHTIPTRSLLGQVPKSAWRGIPAALNGMRVGGLV